MRYLFQILVGFALIIGALAKPAVRLLDDSSGREALVLSSVHSEMVVNVNRLEFDRETATDRDIASMYGVPTEKPVRIIFADEKRFIRPIEKPELIFYGIKNPETDKPMQVQTLHFLADRAMKFGLGGGILGLLILLFVWKKKD